jgi:peptidoglycan-associated lipoprotein
MRSNPNTVILAGFADERGTEEYNRGLGERRAQSVRTYLISLGISPARLQTVSFGEELPADPGHNESAWARNRRVKIGVLR